MSQRAMIAGTAEQSRGGYLIGKQVVGLGHALFARWTVLRAGAHVFDGLSSGNALVPQIGTNVTTYWPGELGTGTASDPVFEQVEASPKKPVGVTMISKQRLRQAPGVADAMLANNLLGVVTAKLDEACLVGTGGAMPTGVLGVNGITLTTGTAFRSRGRVRDAESRQRCKGRRCARALFGRVRLRELLQKRARVGTDAATGYVWDRNEISMKGGASARYAARHSSTWCS